VYEETDTDRVFPIVHHALAATLDSLALPNPAPFVRTMERQRDESGALLAKMA
jgi:hypothetical protein